MMEQKQTRSMKIIARNFDSLSVLRTISSLAFVEAKSGVLRLMSGMCKIEQMKPLFYNKPAANQLQKIDV